MVFESGNHTHKHNLHPLAKAHFSFTCCNKQLHISTRKPENSAGIAQSLLSLTRIPLCNISPLFLATHYNIPSKKSFLADFVRPSADKPNSSLLKVPCNTSRLGSLIPDHLTYLFFFFFSPKKDFLCIAHMIKQNVTNANCASLNCNKDIYRGMACQFSQLRFCMYVTRKICRVEIPCHHDSYFTKKTSQEKLVHLLEVQEKINRMKQQHLAPCPSKTEQTQFNNSDLDQGWRQAGKPQFNSQFRYVPSVLQRLVVLKSANVTNLLQLLPLCNGRDCTYLH